MSLPVLDLVSQRVLGALLEKQMSTPDYYPLTTNALVNACNQSSNRAPVMHLEEAAVLEGLELLRAEGLAWIVSAAGSRTPKYEHRVRERFDLSEQEAAVLCELLLRGPQTPGELRSRTARLYAFQDLAEVETTLDLLASAEIALVLRLPRQPGSRELRYIHTLGEAASPEPPVSVGNPATPVAPSLREELAFLKSEQAALREELLALRAAFETFKGQF